MADLNGKRGRISGTELNDGQQVIHAHVPQVELLRFALDLRSITQGRGGFRTSFLGYEPMPPHLSKALIDAYQKEHGSKE
jgi:elongation factor G